MLSGAPDREIRIGGHQIGPGGPPYVIAEIGVNHDGSEEVARQLIGIAADAGAQAVKFQIFSARSLMSTTVEFAAYQAGRVQDADPAAMLARYEFPESTWVRLVTYARSRSVGVVVTPFSLSDLPLVARLGVDAVKIASPDLVNRPLLMAASGAGLPLLVSTGAANMDEVTDCHRWLSVGSSGRSAGVPHVFLHCVSSYPVEDESANLCWIGELLRHFGGPVGYSDHSTDMLAGALAVAAGATILEKHLTHDCSASGPDHAASADPVMFAGYVAAARRAAVLVGRPGKQVLACERDVRKVSRQSVVAARKLSSGQVLGLADLRIQRPGTGIPAARLEQTIGRRLALDVAEGVPLTEEMLAA